MIAADKNRLKASLTQGTLVIQNKLVELYTSNMNAIAVQGALFASCAFTGYIEVRKDMYMIMRKITIIL